MTLPFSPTATQGFEEFAGEIVLTRLKIPSTFVAASINPLRFQTIATFPLEFTASAGCDAPDEDTDEDALQDPFKGNEASFNTPFDSSQTAVTFPDPSTASLGEDAPEPDKVAGAPQLPLTGIKLAFTNPFSTHTAVAFPLVSVAMRGSEELTIKEERVEGADQV